MRRVRRVSTSTRRFRVSCSRWGPRPARLRKKCFHSCCTDLVEEKFLMLCEFLALTRGDRVDEGTLGGGGGVAARVPREACLSRTPREPDTPPPRTPGVRAQTRTRTRTHGAAQAWWPVRGLLVGSAGAAPCTSRATRIVRPLPARAHTAAAAAAAAASAHTTRAKEHARQQTPLAHMRARAYTHTH